MFREAFSLAHRLTTNGGGNVMKFIYIVSTQNLIIPF